MYTPYALYDVIGVMTGGRMRASFFCIFGSMNLIRVTPVEKIFIAIRFAACDSKLYKPRDPCKVELRVLPISDRASRHESRLSLGNKHSPCGIAVDLYANYFC